MTWWNDDFKIWIDITVITREELRRDDFDGTTIYKFESTFHDVMTWWNDDWKIWIDITVITREELRCDDFDRTTI